MWGNMYYSKSKDISKIVKKYVKSGWYFQHGKKHGKLFAPDGSIVIVPSTPSDGRAVYNFLREVRRCHE